MVQLNHMKTFLKNLALRSLLLVSTVLCVVFYGYFGVTTLFKMIDNVREGPPVGENMCTSYYDVDC